MKSQQSIWSIYSEAGLSQRIIIENIKKYIEAYDDDWIAIHEALQNSIDAIQRSGNSDGEITIEAFLEDERIIISDNGRGFPPNKNLLCPGITDKESAGDTKGYQGVGLKALMYSTNAFSIDSIYQNQHWTFMTEQLHTILAGGEPDYVEEVVDINSLGKTGTTIEYSFPKSIVSNLFMNLIQEYYDPKARWLELYSYITSDKDRLNAQISHLIKWYFQTFTYAGCCNRLLGVGVKRQRGDNDVIPVKPVHIELRINAANAIDKCHPWLRSYFEQSESSSISIPFENKQWDFKDHVDNLKQQPKAYGRSAPEIENFSLLNDDWKARRERYKDHVYMRKMTPDTTKASFRDIYADYLSLVRKRGTTDELLEERYSKLFPQILGIYLVIGRTTFFEKFGGINRGERFIAANGIPTSHEITIRSTSSTWYLETIHFIVDVDERLNYGKKQIANTRLIGHIRDFFSDAYTVLMNLSKDFVREEDRRRDNDSEISTEFVSLQSLEIENLNLIKEPVDENTLIAIFFQLLKNETLYEKLGVQDIDLQIYGLQGKGIYDGKFRWTSEPEPKVDANLLNLEFKISLYELIAEFESPNSQKEFAETDLIIVWDDDIPELETDWKVRGVGDQRRRELDRKGVPQYIKEVIEEDRTAKYKPIIIVREWIEMLKQR